MAVEETERQLGRPKWLPLPPGGWRGPSSDQPHDEWTVGTGEVGLNKARVNEEEG